MPLEDVTEGEGLPQVSGPIKIQCLSIEDFGEGEFGPTMRWSFRVWDAKGEEVKWSDGSSFEWHQYTSEKTTPTATAAIWAQALLGRKLLENEKGEAIQQALVGRSANAFADARESTRNPGKSYSKISAISPILKEEAPATDDGEEVAVPF